MLLLKIFKTRLLEKSFHTLIKNVSFSSPTDVGSHSDGVESIFTPKLWEVYGFHLKVSLFISSTNGKFVQ